MESGPSPLISTAPRPHPARLAPATYPVRSFIDARYGDMDANGHLNNLALESLHENTRATLNARVFPGACISLCDTVLVILDDDGPTPIPDDARTELAALQLRAD